MQVLTFIICLELSLLTLSNGNRCPTNCYCEYSTIDCSENQLLEIPEEIPKTAIKLKLNQNRIANLERSFMIPLKNIESLELQFNGMHKIKAGTFDGMARLRDLDLSNNQLTHLSVNTFHNLHKLTRLKLSCNSLKSIDGVINNLKKLNNLELSYNNISSLTNESLQNLPELRVLDLRNNRISTISVNTFSSLISLRFLNIEDNPLTRLDEVLSNNGLLSYLKVKNCLLQTFPAKLPYSIKFLDVSYNNLTKIKQKHLNLSLQTLQLDHNNLGQIENNSFSQLSKLQELNLHFNFLTEIPHIGNSVFKLNLANNRIKQFNHDAFPQNAPLEELYIQNNTIDSLTPNLFKKTVHIKKIHLGGNNISSFGKNLFASILTLQVLNLDETDIKFMSEDVFMNLSTLTTLSMNNIQTTEKAFNINIFKNLKGLQTLSLENSPVLVKILLQSDAKLGFFRNVSELNMRDNQLTTLPHNTMRLFPRTETFYLEGNKFHCDRRLVWFKQWLCHETPKFLDVDNIVCFTPQQMYMRKIIDMKNNDFVPTTAPPIISTTNHTKNSSSIQNNGENNKIKGENEKEGNTELDTSQGKFIAITISVSLFIVFVTAIVATFYICKETGKLDYGKSSSNEQPQSVNFFISNEKNAPVPPPLPSRMTREDRSSVTSQPEQDITSEERGMRVYTWDG